MLIDASLTLFGIVLLVAGGEALVRGASSLARRLGISTLVIGLTVVAFGTSAPELAVNVAAVARGAGELSFGNIFGSNLANIGLILAIAALLQPLDVRSIVVRREVPMMLLGTLVALALGLDASFGDGPSRYSGGDGAVLLLLFTVFAYYTGRDMIEQRARRAEGRRALGGEAETPEANGNAGAESILASALLTFVGLVGLLIGGQLTVNGAEGIARTLGVPDAIIGLTLVAIGTSLPELVASVLACLRGETDLAVGNVVGSNIFNLFFVLGATSSIGNVPVPAGGAWDLLAVTAFSALLWVVSITARGRIIRAEGALLLVLYIGYVVSRSIA